MTRLPGTGRCYVCKSPLIESFLPQLPHEFYADPEIFTWPGPLISTVKAFKSSPVMIPILTNSTTKDESRPLEEIELLKV